jgi:hypothetical protein
MFMLKLVELQEFSKDLKLNQTPQLFEDLHR